MSRLAPPQGPPRRASPRRPSAGPSPWRVWLERLAASLRLSWRVRLRSFQTRRGRRPRVKRLRLLAIVLALLVLGGISFAFGMFMAVASDLPALEDWQQYKDASNSIMVDDHGHTLAVLSRRDQILVTAHQIPAIMKEAIISIEDKRFYTNEGIDFRSLARAALHDVIGGGGVQGASTIEEEFVKNALAAQSRRTIFEKLREAALAFHLDHRWSKEKILTEYLNTIYFGNGAYGIESAARTYFGREPEDHGCGTLQHLCVSELKPWQAALLAGMVQSPTEYNPVEHPLAARERRNLVLSQMREQGYIDKHEYQASIAAPLPAPHNIAPPREQIAEGVDAGYFTSWVAQQVIAKYGATRAFDGGLKIKTTLDIGLQRAAERAVNTYLSNPNGPTASLVAIENSTGDVRAMVGGRDYETSPFNLATDGERQPGSSFKAFDLAEALEQGISPNSVWPSRMKVFHIPHSKEVFVVHNDEGAYTGTNTLTGALELSDNSIFAEVGIKVGTKKIAALAHRMGITTPISTNYAMTIGGLKTGVTALDMAHAYETIAHQGQRVTGTLAGERGAPVGIQEVFSAKRALPNGRHREVNRPIFHRVLPASIAETETAMLETVIAHGTGTNAALGQFAAGKTGTTTNEVDAWFVGFDHKYTVAVWVGYPQSAKPMTTEYNGQPVYGGTYPALIWKSFQLAAIQMEQERAAGKQSSSSSTLTQLVPSTSTSGSQARTEQQTAAPAGGKPGAGGKAGAGGSAGTPAEQQGPGATNPEEGTAATGEQQAPTATEPGTTESPPAGGTTTGAPQSPGSSKQEVPEEAPTGATGGASAPPGG